jgi:hypothetical protein
VNVHVRISAEFPGGSQTTFTRQFPLDPAIVQACEQGLECGCLEDADIDTKVSAFIAQQRRTQWPDGTLVTWAILGKGAATVPAGPPRFGRRVWTQAQAEQYNAGYYDGAAGQEFDVSDFRRVGRMDADHDEMAAHRNDAE